MLEFNNNCLAVLTKGLMGSQRLNELSRTSLLISKFKLFLNLTFSIFNFFS